VKVEDSLTPKKRKRNRTKGPGAPKYGLGPVVTAQRRAIEDQIEADRKKREHDQLNAARQEVERLTKRYQDLGKDSDRWAGNLLRGVVGAQTVIMRVKGQRQPVETVVKDLGRVKAWTNFKKIRIEWPKGKIPPSLETDAVLDCICQIKGVMQHEMGHLDFTTAWSTVKENAIEPEVTT